MEETTQTPVEQAAEPVVEAPAVAPEKAEQTVDQVEDAILAKMGIGEKAEKPAETPESKPEVKAEKSAVTGHLATLETPEKRADYFRAVRNLQWSGLPKEAIDAMPVDMVLKAGKNAAERRSALDRARSQQNGKADSRQTQASPPSGNRPGKAEPPRKPDPTADQDDDERTLDDESDPLDELLDDEQAAPPVEKPRRRDPEVEKLRELADQRTEQLNAARMQLAIRTVEADFPLIKEGAYASKIAARMDELDGDRSALEEGGEALETLLRQACLIEFGEQIIHQSRAARNEAAESLRNGQPFNATARNKAEKPPSEEDVEDAAYAALKETRWNEEQARLKLSQRFGA